MTIRGVEQHYRSGNEVGLDQRDIEWREPPNDPQYVRSFYFEDVNEQST